MVFAVLDDGTAQVEVSVYAELYEQHRARLRADQLLIAAARVSNDDYSGGVRVIADALYDLQLAREARAKMLCLAINGQANAARLKQLLNPFRAEPENGVYGVPVEIAYTGPQARCLVRLDEDWRVRMDPTLLQGLAEWVSEAGVTIRY